MSRVKFNENPLANTRKRVTLNNAPDYRTIGLYRTPNPTPVS